MIKGSHQTNWRRLVVGFILSVVGYVVVLNLPLNIDPVQHQVAAVSVVFIILWFSEALPLFVTSLLVPILLVIATPLTQGEVLPPFFDPVIALFLGSFVLGVALHKHNLGERAAAFTFKIFGNSPRVFLLGLISMSAFFGMWLSNTATVAFLLPVALYIIKHNQLGRRGKLLGKSILFALAIGAAIGGMGTIVGTPPNAIAIRLLSERGIEIGFLDWMSFGLPLVLVLVPLAWLSLTAVFKPEIKKLKPVVVKKGPLNRNQIATLVILGLTILFWVTGPWHGVPSPIVALSAVVLLYLTNTLGGSDFFKVPFSALIIFGGGLSLAEALLRTGLTDTIAAALTTAFAPLSPELILGLLIILAIVVTLFSSNTAQSAILIPIVISLGAVLGVDVRVLVVATTLALSLDFISPLGTPPATIIYETGLLRFKDFLRAGAIITVLGALILFLAANLLV